MTSNDSSRASFLAGMKTNPLATIDRYVAHRKTGKREMEYTDMSVAFAMARACDDDPEIMRDFRNLPLWSDRGNFVFKANQSLLYCLMYVQGGYEGSPGNRASHQNTALRVAFDNPDVEAEDLVEVIKRGGGIVKMAKAARERKPGSSERTVPAKLAQPALSKGPMEVDEESSEDVESGEASALGETDFQDEDLPRLKSKKSRAVVATRTPEDIWDAKYEDLQKRARELRVIIVNPSYAGLLREICKMDLKTSKKLIITRKPAPSDWIEISGVSLDDVIEG